MYQTNSLIAVPSGTEVEVKFRLLDETKPGNGVHFDVTFESLDAQERVSLVSTTRAQPDMQAAHLLLLKPGILRLQGKLMSPTAAIDAHVTIGQRLASDLEWYFGSVDGKPVPSQAQPVEHESAITILLGRAGRQ